MSQGISLSLFWEKIMEAKKKVLEHELEDHIYDRANTGKKRFIGFGLLLFFLGIILNYPLKKTVNGILAKSLKPPKKCPYSYKDASFEFFMPKVIFKDLHLPGSCFNSPKSSLDFENAKVFFRGLSLSPLGLSTKVETNFRGQDLEVYAAVAPKRQKIKIPKTTASTSLLNPFLQNALTLEGNLTVEGLAELEKNKLQEGNLLINSTDLRVPAQNIKGFDMEALDLKDLILKATVGKNGQLKVRELKVGNDKAPLHLNLNGRVNLILSNPNFSQLSLDGTLKVSPKLIKKMPLLNAVLGSLKKQGDSYLVKISGTLGSPRFL